MRTLKKSLSLVLVLAMVFSFCAMGTSAAFADQDEISPDYAQAIEVMNGLGILKGDDDGFRPADTLTRAEACVIIVKMLDALDLAKTATCTFDDAADHWAAPYIGYCAAEGIVSGVGDNNFAPNAPLSGYAFALMILRACGYVPANENWNADQWELCTVKLAKNAGLVEDVADITAETFTREMAAGMAFDGMFVGSVAYTGGTTVTLPGGATVTTGASKDSTHVSTYFCENYNLGATYGVVVGNQATGAESTEIALLADTDENGKIDDGEIENTATSFNIESDLDLIGKVVVVYYNDEAVKGVYSVYTYGVVSETITVDAKSAVSTTPDDGNTAKVLALIGKKTTVAADGVSFDATVADTAGKVTAVSTGTDATDGAIAAGSYEVFNGEIVSYCAPITKTTSVVRVSYDKTNGYYTVGTAGDTDLYVEYNAITKEYTNKVVEDIDWMSFVENDAATTDVIFTVSQTGTVYHMEEIATVIGKVTKVVNNSGTNDEIWVDGQKYVAADGDALLYGVAAKATSAKNAKLPTSFTTEYKFFLNADGKIFAYQATAETPVVVPDTVYVVGVYQESVAGNYGAAATYYTYAQTVGLDGVEGKVLIGVHTAAYNSSSKDTTAADANGVDFLAAGLYTFKLTTNTTAKALGINEATEVSSTASTENLYKATHGASDATKLTTESKKYGNVYLTADTTFLFVKGTATDGVVTAAPKTQVVEGGINFTIATAANVLVLATNDKDGNVIASYVIVTGVEYKDAGTAAENMVYVPATITSTAATASGYEYEVYDAATGEKFVLYSKTAVEVTAGFHKYTTVDGYTTFETAETEGDAVKLAEQYTGRYGTKIRTTALTTDTEAKDAIIVDVRTAAQKTASGVDTLTSIDAIAAAVAAGKTVTFDLLVSATAGVTIIFVNGPTA